MLKHLQKAINHLAEGEARELLFKTLTQLYSLEAHFNKEIVPEKLLAIRGTYKGTSPLTKEERQALENEWETLREEHTVLRIWENNRAVSVSEDYIDHFIVQCAKSLETDGFTDQFYKAARLVGEVLGHFEQYVGDSFIEYRLKTLIQKGVFQMKGSLQPMRFYSVRLA